MRRKGRREGKEKGKVNLLMEDIRNWREQGGDRIKRQGLGL